MVTLPTKVTIARIVLTGAVVALLFLPGLAAKAACLALFLLASWTDWLDGYLARRFNQISPLGILLDPIADKVLVLGVLISFIFLRLVSAWMALIIVAREVLVTGARLSAARRQVVIAAAPEGKQKTVFQMAAVILILVSLILRELPGLAASVWAAVWLPRVTLTCLWIAVLLTVISGLSFFWRRRAVLWPHGASH